MTTTPSPTSTRAARPAVECAAAAPVVVVETMLALSWLDGSLGAAQAMAAHLAVAAALAGASWLARRHPAARTAPLLAVATLLLGPLGAAGMLLATLIGATLANDAATMERWLDELLPEDDCPAAQRHYQRIVCGRDRLADGGIVRPFLDVLAVGPLDRQLAAVATMSRRFHPAFAPALRAALQHPVPQVRVQAAAAATHIENGFAQRLARVQAGVRGAPDSAAAWLALARHYDDHPQCGLLDTDREQQSRHKALHAYARCLELDADDEAAAEGMARLLARLGRPEQVAALMRRHPALRTQPWYADHLFRHHRLSELHALMADAAPSLPAPVRRLWKEALP